MNSRFSAEQSSYNSCLACIFSLDQQFLGLGFLISSHKIVTCAHVIPDTASEVSINFPFSNQEGHQPARVIARSTGDPLDIACLELNGNCPANSNCPPMRYNVEIRGHRFRTFGFPQHIKEGIWVHGLISDANTTGWIQLDRETSSVFVESGFSGAPVWDEILQCVVGMIVGTRQHDGQRIAYMIPMEMIFSSLNLYPPNDKLEPLRNWSYEYPTFKYEKNFTGRNKELQEISRWFLDRDAHILEINGGVGTGKSSLVYHWVKYYANIPSDWYLIRFSFANTVGLIHSFTGWLLLNLKVMGDQSVKSADYKKRIDTVIELMKQKNILLILDQFDLQLFLNRKLHTDYKRRSPTLINRVGTDRMRRCIDGWMAYFIGELVGKQRSKTIIISREKVRELEDNNGQLYGGCWEINLNGLQPMDAVALLRAQGITKGSDEDLKQVASRYQYQPDTIRMLSSIIIKDKKEQNNISVANRPHVKSLFQVYSSKPFQLVLHALNPEQRDRVGWLIKTAARSGLLHHIIKSSLEIWSKIKSRIGWEKIED
jgi:hypothetical protein